MSPDPRDRQASALFGCWRSTVTEEYVPYVMPQEHGHKGERGRAAWRRHQYQPAGGAAEGAGQSTADHVDGLLLRERHGQ